MPARWGLGPVFAYEWLTASRRWQMYALRAGFVALLFVAVLVVWFSKAEPIRRAAGPIDRNAYAAAGEALFYAFFGTLLSVTLLVAPGATAGAVCLDKARGTLLHVLVTDLSSAEIVLGKLAARLLPLVGLVAASVPVLSLCLWLGGIDPEAMLVAYSVTAGIAVLGCALALLLSVWGRKTYEVLLVAYLFEALLLLAYPAALQLDGLWRQSLLAPAMSWTNPFLLALSPYLYRGATDPTDLTLFLAFCLGGAALCTALAVVSVRPAAVRSSGRSRPPRPPRAARRPWLRLPAPSLDFNPVLWLEWNRRASRWARFVWAVFWLMFGGAGALAAAGNIVARSPDRFVSTWIAALGVAGGLLLASVTAVTALADERVRGSLDVLLATPLPTPVIVRGKWWGAFRPILPLAVVPTVLAGTLVARSGQWEAVPLMAGYVLACGASVTSLGLALAVWVRSPPRAITAAVVVYCLVTVGWVALALTAVPDHGTSEQVACLSPFFGAAGATYVASGDAARNQESVVGAVAGWAVVHLLAAAALYGRAVRTFSRCLGRIDGPPRSAAVGGNDQRALQRCAS
jgi:ABC-type transport system involved in multi-copper enzyme maturation permease subunit